MRKAIGGYGRQPLRNSGQGRVSVGRTVPAPVGGWDANSALADMPPENAVVLDNFIPRAGYVELRKGYTAWQNGLSLPVETGMVYRSTGNDQIFGASGGAIYNMTSLSETPVEVYSDTGSARFQWINFANDAGTFIIADNGAVPPLYYNGSSWSQSVITGTSGVITLDPATLVDVMEHKGRLFHVQKDSMRVWYLAPNAIQGDAKLLDLGPVFDKGGSILCQSNWTIDGGAGADDLAVWVTTQGQVAVYQGIDPSDANDWALVGIYDVGLPLSRRSLMKYGADLVVLTTDGVVPLSQALSLDRAQEDLVALTAKIQPAFQRAAQSYRNNFGWECSLYQKGSLAFVNVPTAELTRSQQYVQNIQTGAWCRFTGINAFCWFIANDNMMFGANDGIYQWDSGAVDGDNIITADLETAWNYFGSKGSLKKFEMMQPVLRSSTNLFPAIEMLTDFKERAPTNVPTVVEGNSGLWGSGLWGEALWSAATQIRDGWTGATGIGYCGSVRMQLVSDAFTYIDLAVGDGSLLGVDEAVSLEIQSVARSQAIMEIVAFNVKYENQVGGQL